MNRTLLLLALVLVSVGAAQNTPKQWGSIGVVTRFGASGVTLGYGQQNLLAPGTDARFSATYVDAFSGEGFIAEVGADALAYTYDPRREGLSLVAYGGLGPRLYVQTLTYLNSYQLNVGGVGGLEARLQNVGVFLELDFSLPTFGIVDGSLRAFPFEVTPIPRLTLGANYFL